MLDRERHVYPDKPKHMPCHCRNHVILKEEARAGPRNLPPCVSAADTRGAASQVASVPATKPTKGAGPVPGFNAFVIFNIVISSFRVSCIPLPYKVATRVPRSVSLCSIGQWPSSSPGTVKFSDSNFGIWTRTAYCGSRGLSSTTRAGPSWSVSGKPLGHTDRLRQAWGVASARSATLRNGRR